jgi:hypothetical protein
MFFVFDLREVEDDVAYIRERYFPDADHVDLTIAKGTLAFTDTDQSPEQRSRGPLIVWYPQLHAQGGLTPRPFDSLQRFRLRHFADFTCDPEITSARRAHDHSLRKSDRHSEPPDRRKTEQSPRLGGPDGFFGRGRARGRIRPNRVRPDNSFDRR